MPSSLPTSLLSLLGVISLASAFPLQLPSLSTLFPRQFTSDTMNQLTDGTPCRPTTILYARGTTQDGNVGDSAAVGPLWFNALAANLGGADKMAVQGVDYPASILGFLQGGDDDGADTMRDLVNRAASQCPDTKIVMSGYSQGGQLVHKAAEGLGGDVLGRVAAVMIFGDPDNGDAVGDLPASKVTSICHDGDNICDGGLGGFIVTSAHLNYQDDAVSAAATVAKMLA